MLAIRAFITPRLCAVIMSDELVNFEVGESAPDFEAELTDGTTIRLSEILHGGEKVTFLVAEDAKPQSTQLLPTLEFSEYLGSKSSSHQ